MNTFFPEMKKNFAFGMMRLPMNGDKVDFDATSNMVDQFLERGFNYFDTAHPYIGGQSEEAVKKCLSSRYPREKFLLTNKLSGNCFSKEEEIRPFFESQLKNCGVEYFDFYLMHAMNAKRHEVYQETRAYEIARELKAEGKIRHVGMSFHDQPEVLDKILTDCPWMEVVQLQFNYVDYADPKVASKACYDVCVKHGKPVLIMEPVKGGSLVNLPSAAKALIPGSPAGFAIRFAASFENNIMILSGMSSPEQMKDNLDTMENFVPLSDAEMEIVEKVRTIYQAEHRIPCTGCEYCVAGCPMQIPIPKIFSCLNTLKGEHENDPKAEYAAFSANASDCISCGQCANICPQHLQIPELMQEVARVFA